MAVLIFDVVCGPITGIAVHIIQPLNVKNDKRECGLGHVTLIFWALGANSSKMAKDRPTNFKFGMHGKQESRAIAKMTMRCAL